MRRSPSASASAFAFAFACALACGKGEPPALRVVVTGQAGAPVPADAISVLEARAEALGAVVVEPQGDGSVVIGFPVSSGEDATRSLVAREVFTLWVVDEHVPQAQTEEEARQNGGGRPVVRNASGYGEPWLVLTPPAVVTAADVTDAEVGSDAVTGQPHVMVTFDDPAAKRFGDATAAHVGERLAIVAGGKCVSAPQVREAIRGGQARIDMGASSGPEAFQEAKDLAAVLDAGELPAPLEVREVSTW